MTQSLIYLLTLLFSLSSPALKGTAEIWHSTLAAEGGLVQAIRNVNPRGGTMNCANCAIAGDAALAGNPASAVPGGQTYISILEDTFGGFSQPVSGPMQIGCIQSGFVPPDGRPTGPMAIESAGLIFKIDTRTYRCLHDQIATSLGVARRLHLVLM